jgi:hypothetical protein
MMRTSTLPIPAAIGAALLLSVSACSSQSASSGGDGGGAEAACQGSGGASADAYVAPTLDAEVCNNHGQEVDNYYPGMTMAGSSGNFDFVLDCADPAPPSDPLLNTWVVKVVDKTGATVKDATITLPVSNSQWQFMKNPWMPYMGHGGTIGSTVTNHGDGTATAVLDFSMRDYWQAKVCAQSGSKTDCAKFSFCLP